MSQDDTGKKDTQESSQSGQTESSQIPSVNFASLVLSLNASALAHLGEIPVPGTEEKKKDLDLAKHAIETLTVLKDKTKGNLTKDEEALMDAVLYELRMKFVQADS
jgi:hypothetical protein